MSKVFNVSFLHAKGKNQIRDGLMYRKKKLKKNQGMLFHTGLKVSSFWMENTFIPLDVLFLNKNGKIIGYKEKNKPHSLKAISIGKRSFYVLEMNAGWVKNNKVKVGDKIKIRNRKKTRKKRGGQGGTQSKPKLEKEDEDSHIYSLSSSKRTEKILKEINERLIAKSNQIMGLKADLKDLKSQPTWTSLDLDATAHEIRLTSMYKEENKLKADKIHYEKLVLFLKTQEEERRKKELQESTKKHHQKLYLKEGGKRRRKTRKKRGGNDVCAICQGQLPGVSTRNNSSTFTLTDCPHKYHKVCLIQWISTSIRNHNAPTCPLCRSPIQTNDFPEGINTEVQRGTFNTNDGFDMNSLIVIASSINYDSGHGVLSPLIGESTPQERSLYFRLIRTVVQLGTGDVPFTAQNVFNIYRGIRTQYDALNNGVPSQRTIFYEAINEDIDRLEGWIGP